MPLFLVSWFICQTNQIIRRKLIKTAKRDEVINFEFSPAILDMTVSLLRLVDDLPNFCLR